MRIGRNGLDPAAEQIFRTYRGARTCGNAQNTGKRKIYLVNQENEQDGKAGSREMKRQKRKHKKQYRLKQQISRFQTRIIKKAEKAAHAVAAGAVKAARAINTDGSCGAWYE